MAIVGEVSKSECRNKLYLWLDFLNFLFRADGYSCGFENNCKCTLLSQWCMVDDVHRTCAETESVARGTSHVNK